VKLGTFWEVGVLHDVHVTNKVVNKCKRKKEKFFDC